MDYIKDQKLSCHHDDPKQCLTGPSMCTAMNACNSNGACSDTTGKCTCKPGFYGADCAYLAEPLVDNYLKTFTKTGTQWLYFSFTDGLQANEYYELTLSSQNPMDIFISSRLDVDPNEFNPNEFELLRQSYIKLSSKAFPTLSKFVAAVRVNGIDFISNRYTQSKVRAEFNKKAVPTKII